MRQPANMQPMCSRWCAALSILTAALAAGATRPHYGGTLRVEVRESFETADPPQNGRGMADLPDAFTISRWEAGRLAVYSANENAAGGRPYLDSVEIQMGRPLREQAIDLEAGKADVGELGVTENRRPAAGRKTWTSAPVRLIALVFGPRVTDARVREALAWAVDRSAIHSVLLQRQGEITGALLPQWISGYAFLFPSAVDLNRARMLAASAPAAARTFSLGFEDAGLRPIAERIVLNARDAGLAVTVSGNADVKLIETRVEFEEPWRALAGVAAALGLPEPARADASEALFEAERGLLAGYRVIPLFHLPDVYGAAARVKGGPGITPLGVWRFGDLWVEGSRP
jgi:Bacterial extracellular solute-binding proteins, family 5 Middle